DVIQVLLRKAQPRTFQRGRRRTGDLLVAFAIRGEQDVAGHTMFAGDLAVVVDDLYHESLRVGVVVALSFDFQLAVAQFLDDLRDRAPGGLVGDGGGIRAGRLRRPRRSRLRP